MDISDRKAVAVVIACHDAAPTIAAAVRSALAQPETAEVFVIDDASSDGSFEAATAADDGTGRLTVLRLTTNRGPAAARNLGFARARSTWLAVLDADDLFLPGRLTALLRYADAADLIADDPWRVPQQAIHGPRQAVIGVAAPRLVSFAAFVEGNVPQPGRPGREWGYVKPLLRRRFLERHRLRYQESMRLGEDYELYARALALGARFLLLPPQGYLHIQRAHSLSTRHTTNDLRRLRDCDRQLAALPGLTGADLRALRRHTTTTECILQGRLLMEAIHAGNLGRATARFLQPWPIPLHLLRLLRWRLWLWLKARGRPLTRGTGKAGCEDTAVVWLLERLLLAWARPIRVVDNGRPYLVIAPHPDDETLGCGATIARARQVGIAVHVLVVTDGSAHPPGIERRELAALRGREVVEACTALGLPSTHVQLLGFADGQAMAHIEPIAERLLETIRRLDPERIFAPSGIDNHADHRAVAEALRRLRQQGRIRAALYSYPIWFWSPRFLLRALASGDFLRLRMVATGPFLDRKRQALARYGSQSDAGGEGGGEGGGVLTAAVLRRFLQPRELFFERLPGGEHAG